MQKSSPNIIVFTDGACSGNPGKGGWGAVICINTSNQSLQVVERGGYGGDQTTNNAMELMATVECLNEFLKLEQANIKIITDSRYVLQGAEKWLKSWKRRGWKTAEGQTIANLELWKSLDQIIARYSGQIEWEKVPAHSGQPINEKADKIAVAFSHQLTPELFEGAIEDSDFDFNDFTSTSVKDDRSYPFYLSYVDGQCLEHSTWAECENRVQGRSGAKFKKIKNATQQASTLKAWGLKQ